MLEINEKAQKQHYYKFPKFTVEKSLCILLTTKSKQTHTLPYIPLPMSDHIKIQPIAPEDGQQIVDFFKIDFVKVTILY